MFASQPMPSRAVLAAIDIAKRRNEVRRSPQEAPKTAGAVAILHVGGVDLDGRRAAVGVGQGEASNATGPRETPSALAAIDLLAGVIAAWTAAFGGLHGLASVMGPVRSSFRFVLRRRFHASVRGRRRAAT
jgi:hypothetical protein